MAQLIVGAGIGKPDARILDFGTGVGALAIAFCRTFPDSTVVGIDPWELSLELARQNVSASGFDARITLRQTRIETFQDDDGFDIIWMPVIFLSRAILEEAVRRAVETMRPGAEIVLGPTDTRALLEDAGLVDVREIERTWPAPLGLTAGRRR